MSRYVVEWHEVDKLDVRSEDVHTDREPSERLFAGILAARHGLLVGEVKVYMWLLQDEPRSSLNGRWGSFFRN